MPNPPERHQRPNESCLEPYREEIVERRRLEWPYRRLAQWLADEHQLTISAVAIRNFCLVRHIKKGEAPRTSSPRQPASSKSKTTEREAWNFNTEGPLEVYQ